MKHTMKFIFCMIVLLIVYGSLFPFNISVGPVSESSLKALFNFKIGKTGFSDLVANIILFIPFGIFIKAAFPSKRPTFSFINFMLIGFVFAFLIQVMQLWTSNRLPWGGDAIWNAVGCAIGLIIHSFIKLNTFKQLHSLEGYKQISFALALAIIVMNLAPFAPSIDFGVLKDNTKAMILNPSIDIYWTFEHTLFWLVAFYLLNVANPKWSRFRVLVLTVSLVLALKFIIISSNISLSRMLAGGLALVIWRFLPIRNAPLLAGLMLLAIIGNGLHPFEMSATVGNFNWLPFTGSMRGNILLNIIATTEKLVFYGSVIWLIYLVNKKLLMGTIICALVLLGSEFTQTMFTDSVSESTDALLAIIMAFIFSQKLKYSNESSDTISRSEQNTPKENKNGSANSMKSAKILVPILIAFVVLAIVLFVLNSSNKTSQINQAPWASPASDVMIFDHHAHTTYSDGNLSVEELSELAFFKGCDAFSITDHSENSKSFSDAKLAEISAMRAKYPGMLIFAGIELGVPSYKGREHVNILTTPEFEFSVLPAVLEAVRKPTEDQITDKQKDILVFSAIDTIAKAAENTVAIYNHPSRKDQSKEENMEDFRHWNSLSNNIVAFSGAPGHQKSKDIGSYRSKYKTINRWDPVVAEVGGTWDQLLLKGERVWGAIASSDYHGEYMDFGPCEYSRIHVTVPSKDYNGLIKGIKAGTFWADHGKLLNTFDFNVTLNSDQQSNDQNKFARIYPGGSVKLLEGPHVLSVAVNVKRNTPYKNDFMRVDIISNCGREDVVLSSKYMPPEQNKFQSLVVLREEKNCFVRARVVRETIEGNDLSAYSNPIFIEF